MRASAQEKEKRRVKGTSKQPPCLPWRRCGLCSPVSKVTGAPSFVIGCAIELFDRDKREGPGAANFLSPNPIRLRVFFINPHKGKVEITISIELSPHCEPPDYVLLLWFTLDYTTGTKKRVKMKCFLETELISLFLNGQGHDRADSLRIFSITGMS